MSEKQLESKVRELRELQAFIEEMQEEAEAIRDTLKAQMGEAEELRAGEYKITWKFVSSTRIDTTALKKALPDVAERFTKQTTSRRFCVA